MHQLKRASSIIPIIFLAAVVLSAGAGFKSNRKTPEPVWMRTPDVVYVGTPFDIASKMLQLAQVTKKDVVYDLGCGDARMIILAAKKYGCHAAGFDIDPSMINLSKKNVEEEDLEDLVEIVQADMFTLDLSKASVLALYLLPQMNKKLLPQIEKMKPGSRLVFHDYEMEDMIPDETIRMTSNEDNASHTIYLYTIPLKRKN
jgi:predicted RNA methylase